MFSKPSTSIRLKQVLEMTQNRDVPFAISYFQFDQKKGSTGELIELDRVIRCGLPWSENMDEMGMIGVKKVDDSGHPYPIRTWLIDSFNGLKVFI
jgi:hypothetical protein